MAVGDLAGSGASGVDRHDPQSGIIPLRLRQPLEQHRMRQAAFEPTSTTRSLFSTSS